MKIVVTNDDGTENLYENVREFALCGLHMIGPFNPAHFLAWSGTKPYLVSQTQNLIKVIEEKEAQGE